MRSFARFFGGASLAALSLSLASAQVTAPACQFTNSNLLGTYVGSAMLENGVAATTTTGGTGGTTTTTTGNGFSNTAIGGLLSQVSTGTQFAGTGTVVFDGAGNITATPSATNTATSAVGTYNVNPDCTVTITLNDAFATSSTVSSMKFTFIGVVLGGGSEIDLTTAPAATSTSTGGTTTGGTAVSFKFGSGPVIKLTRISGRTFCTTGNIRGLFGFVLNTFTNPSSTISTGGTTVTSLTPATTIGYIVFDGAGNITSTNPNPVAVPVGTTPAPNNGVQPLLDFTGTYTVNPDCSGTITISNTGTASTSASSLTLNFVQEGTGNTTPFNLFAQQFPQLALTVSNSSTGMVGSGYAIAQ